MAGSKIKKIYGVYHVCLVPDPMLLSILIVSYVVKLEVVDTQ